MTFLQNNPAIAARINHTKSMQLELQCSDILETLQRVGVHFSEVQRVAAVFDEAIETLQMIERNEFIRRRIKEAGEQARENPLPEEFRKPIANSEQKREKIRAMVSSLRDEVEELRKSEGLQ